MAKETRMTIDGAMVKTKGQDLTVSPRRFAMFGAAVLIGLFGVIAIPAGGMTAINALGEGDLEEIITGLGFVLLGFGLLSVAYFAFNKGRSQKAIHFDATQRQIKVGQEMISFDHVSGVYLQHSGTTTLGDLSGTVIQTGIIANQKPLPIGSVSRGKAEDNMSDVATLVRLYAEHLGYDPKVIGRYEDLLKLDLPKGTPVILSFTTEK